MKQLGLRFSKNPRGGARDGAGRKTLPAGSRHTPHRARGKHRAAHPVHVTMRSSVRSLRSQHVVRTVLGALRQSNRERFRIVHYSVQANHLHLIVEAENKEALSSGMRGLAVRMARRVNKLLFRGGRFWADRWHGHTLETPRQVRNALVYVLQNHNKHFPSKLTPALDRHSSAEWFDGFSKPIPSSFRSIGPPSVCSPQRWLLRVGWLRRGRICPSEMPRSAHGSEAAIAGNAILLRRVDPNLDDPAAATALAHSSCMEATPKSQRVGIRERSASEGSHRPS